MSELLPLATWVPILDGDPEAAAMYLDHYSSERSRQRRVERGTMLTLGPGQKLLLSTPCRRATFAWRAFYKRFDSFPEVRFGKGEVTLKSDAYLAWLDSRKLVADFASDLHRELRGWQPIAKFFEAEPETPTVLLWAPHPVSGEFAVQLGYWDDDERAWFRECEGPECAPLEPTKWMALAELMRSADDREFVTVPRLSDAPG